MKSRSSKWACAALGLMVAIGFLPALASAQVGTVEAGTATQVGVLPPPPPGPGGKGQVRISGTFPCPPSPDLDLSQCDLVIHEILLDPGNGELVHADRCIETDIPARKGSSSKDAVYEVDLAQRPTCRMQIKNRGRNECEFQLKVDRAVIDVPSGDPVLLETAFDLVGSKCTAPVPTFDASASWRNSPFKPFTNWRAVRP